MLEWYLFRVKTRMESKAAQQCKALGLESFFPLIQYVEPHTDSKVRFKPLFSGYLFVRMDFHSSPLRTVLNLTSVAELVRIGGQVVPVELALVRALRRRCSQEKVAAYEMPKRGEKVRFSLGAFQGVDAIFDEVDENQRCRLLIELMNQTQAISVPLHSLEIAC